MALDLGEKLLAYFFDIVEDGVDLFFEVSD